MLVARRRFENIDKQRALQPLQRFRLEQQGADDEENGVGGKTPEQGMDQRVLSVQSEQGLRPEQIEAPGAVLDCAGRKQQVALETGQEQGVAPEQEADQQTEFGAARGGPLPVDAAKQGGQELGNAGKGDQTDGGQRVRLAAEPEIEIAEQQDETDADAPADQ